MANIIRIKRRTSGSPGAPTSLANAELAYNEVDDILYYGKGTGGAGGTATTIPAIAGPGAYLTLATTQTVSGDKTFSGQLNAVTQANGDNSTKVATTAFVKNLGYQTGNQVITLSGDASGSGSTAITVTLASVGTAGTYTKVTTDAKGRVTSGTTLADTDIPSLLASKISNFDTQVRTSRLDQMAAPTAAVSLNNQRITNLANPVSDTDAANKAYVDATAAGLTVKQAVDAASTANVTVTYNATGGTSARGQITGVTNVIDGVTLAVGYRVLLKNQTTASQNGIWTVTTVGTGANGVWDRATDFDQDADVRSGVFVFVASGTTNAQSGWIVTTPDPIVVGGASGSNITWAQFSGAGQITAGAGLTKTGNTLDVGAGVGIAVNADTVDLTGQALALHNLATNGFFVRTAAATIAARSITTTGTGISVSNGDGVAANPAISLTAALSSIGGLTPAADALPYYTGASTAAVTTLTAFARTLLDDTTAATARTTLGLGTMATQNANAVAITGGTIDNIEFDGGTF